MNNNKRKEVENCFEIRGKFNGVYSEWLGITLQVPKNIFELQNYERINLYLDKIFYAFRDALLNKYLGADYIQKYEINRRRVK